MARKAFAVPTRPMPATSCTRLVRSSRDLEGAYSPYLFDRLDTRRGSKLVTDDTAGDSHSKRQILSPYYFAPLTLIF